jgi:hypothetical protein
MIDVTLDQPNALLHARLTGPLRAEDFDGVAATVDPFIAQHGALRGVILEIPHFPGWENVGAAVRHFRFVQDHHRRIRKIAVVTDSALGSIAEHITAHFVAADVKHFPAAQVDAARAWILAPGSAAAAQ